MKEIDLPGYYITEDGRLWSSKTNKFLKTTYNKGYEQIILLHEGKMYNRQIHRLVAIAYIPNPENKPQINHIDFDKSNNAISNLEWVTCSENQIHSWINNRREYTREIARISVKKACEVRKKRVRCLETGEEYESSYAASRALGLSNHSVSASINNNTKCGGKTWMYI